VKLIKNAVNKKYEKASRAGYEYESEAFAECFKTEEHKIRIREIKKIIKEDN